jgi:osmoprotectant transport system permease protein
VPLTGLGVETVVLGLGLYSLTILVRSMIDGLRAVPDDVRESALGMGYAPARLLWRVELPLALPTIMGGVRVATVSAVALTTVGAILDYGGLGSLLIEGSSTNFKAQVLFTSFMCVALAVALDLLLVGLQRALTPWRRTAASR